MNIFRTLQKYIRRNPKLYCWVKENLFWLYTLFIPTYPRPLGGEVKAVKKVLKSPLWNMSYGTDLVHNKLEEEFASFIGTRYAICVNTGGMAIQISLRALGLKPGDEVIHQVDTCVADAFAVLNAGATPVFSDISMESFGLLEEDIERNISSHTRAIMPIHIWGNPENMDMVRRLAEKHKLIVIEDAALAFGAQYKGKKVGSLADVGIFSFGSTKPIQTGEGGMITTNNEALARELRTIRHWGEMTSQYGVRDQRTLSWNGRMSEIVAAVALEQVRAYAKMLERIRGNVAHLSEYLEKIEGMELVHAGQDGSASIYAQAVVKIDEKALGISKEKLMNRLRSEGIPVWHANFEPINSLSFFKGGEWKNWVIKGDIARIEKNYSGRFENSETVYGKTGLGFMRYNFLSRGNVKYLIKKLDSILIYR